MRTAGMRCQVISRQVQHGQRRHVIRNTYPEPETEKERSSVDFPQVLPGVAQGAVPTSSLAYAAKECFIHSLM